MSCATLTASAQKQLVFLRGQKVLHRMYPGDDFVYKLKDSKKVETSYVNNLSDTAVVTHRDTIPFHHIERIYFSQGRFMNLVGTALVIFGSGLFLIDQINVTLVQGNSPNLDKRVTTISIASLGVGLPLMLLRKKSHRVHGRNRLLTVDRASFFYKPDRRPDPFDLN